MFPHSLNLDVKESLISKVAFSLFHGFSLFEIEKNGILVAALLGVTVLKPGTTNMLRVLETRYKLITKCEVRNGERCLVR